MHKCSSCPHILANTWCSLPFKCDILWPKRAFSWELLRLSTCCDLLPAFLLARLPLVLIYSNCLICFFNIFWMSILFDFCIVKISHIWGGLSFQQYVSMNRSSSFSCSSTVYLIFSTFCAMVKKFLTTWSSRRYSLVFLLEGLLFYLSHLDLQSVWN